MSMAHRPRGHQAQHHARAVGPRRHHGGAGVNGHDRRWTEATKVDVEKRAKKLLAEAGYPDGFEVRLNCPNNRYVNDEKICQAVVAMWAKIGIRLAQLAAENMATFIQKVQNFDSSICYLLGWGVATYDAQYTLQS